MSAAPDANAKPPVPAQEPTRKMLADENAALRARVAELEAEVATMKTRAVGEDDFILLVSLRHDGKVYAAGALVPFNPEAPPKGCDGLEEGVHYERARVIVRN